MWKNSNLNIRVSAEEGSCREGVTKVGELDGGPDERLSQSRVTLVCTQFSAQQKADEESEAAERSDIDIFGRRMKYLESAKL